MKIGVIVFFAPALALAGPPPPGNFSAVGFQGENASYEIPFAESSNLISNDWLVTNWTIGKAGSFDKPKSGKRYVVDWEIDADGDGEAERFERFRDDIRLMHRRTDGQIFVRTFPIAPGHEGKNLVVHARRFAQAMTGRVGSSKVETKRRFFRPPVSEISSDESGELVAYVLESAPTKVAGQDAVAATIDVVRPELAAINPVAVVSRRMRVVIVRHKAKVKAEDGVVSSILVFGFVDHPHDYATLLPEFEAFVQRVRLH